MGRTQVLEASVAPTLTTVSDKKLKISVIICD